MVLNDANDLYACGLTSCVAADGAPPELGDPDVDVTQVRGWG